jgi:predicted protein tyrosine phosphatase
MNKTEQIFNLSAPFDNPYQSPRTKILFVCSAGLLRSPTGAAVGIQRGYNTRSCGTLQCALIPLSVNLIEWAEFIVFVNKENYTDAIRNFEAVGYDEDINKKKIILSIPDSYNAFDPTLVRLFNEFFDEWESNAAKPSNLP